MPGTAAHGTAGIAYTDAMAGQLHQMNMEYSPAQDRLVLKINTTDKQECRLFLTRRFTRELWGGLVRVFEQNPEVKQQADPAVKKAMMAFGQAAQTQDQNFDKAYEKEAEAFPLGETPALLTGFKYAPKGPGGVPRLVFVTETKQEIGIPATEQILFSFAKLLSQAVGVTGWDITLTLDDVPDKATAAPSAKVH